MNKEFRRFSKNIFSFPNKFQKILPKWYQNFPFKISEIFKEKKITFLLSFIQVSLSLKNSKKKSYVTHFFSPILSLCVFHSWKHCMGKCETSSDDFAFHVCRISFLLHIRKFPQKAQRCTFFSRDPILFGFCMCIEKACNYEKSKNKTIIFQDNKVYFPRARENREKRETSTECVFTVFERIFQLICVCVWPKLLRNHGKMYFFHHQLLLLLLLGLSMFFVCFSFYSVF